MEAPNVFLERQKGAGILQHHNGHTIMRQKKKSPMEVQIVPIVA
jgi:hypothetical protein